MEVKTLNDKPTNIFRKLNESKTSNVYLLDDKHTIFKEFKPKGNIEIINFLHPDFPAYIEYLESLESEALIIPETLYTKDKKGHIDSYCYSYLEGLPIHKFPPKLRIKRFIAALSTLMQQVKDLESDLILKDAHIGNIIYTGKALKLIDVDFFFKPTPFDDVTNEAILNSSLLRFLFDDYSISVIREQPHLRNLYVQAELGYPCIVELLTEYISYLEERNQKEVEYFRDIKGKHLIKRGRR